MINISKHISYLEATRSSTATRLGIDNTPTPIILNNMELVANQVFEPLRVWYNNPIRINSFYRCDELNKAVGGSITSSHIKGEAIDIDTKNDNALLFKYIRENLVFDQLIWEYGDDDSPAWVHVSFSKDCNRKEVLKAFKVNGETKFVRL